MKEIHGMLFYHYKAQSLHIGWLSILLIKLNSFLFILIILYKLYLYGGEFCGSQFYFFLFFIFWTSTHTIVWWALLHNLEGNVLISFILNFFPLLLVVIIETMKIGREKNGGKIGVEGVRLMGENGKTKKFSLSHHLG